MKIKELTLEQAKLLCDKYMKIINGLYQCDKCSYGDNGYCKLSISNLNRYGNRKIRKQDMEVLKCEK